MVCFFFFFLFLFFLFRGTEITERVLMKPWKRIWIFNAVFLVPNALNRINYTPDATFRKVWIEIYFIYWNKIIKFVNILWKISSSVIITWHISFDLYLELYIYIYKKTVKIRNWVENFICRYKGWLIKLIQHISIRIEYW